MSAQNEVRGSKEKKQFSTFFVAGRLYGIDVMKVQEITQSLPLTRVPLAPQFVHGLINLRGQIATAVGLRELFELKDKAPEQHMNVVCRADSTLFSLLVDQVGDVMEVEETLFESTPDTIPQSVRKFMTGVYKIQGNLLSIIEIEKISEILNH